MSRSILVRVFLRDDIPSSFLIANLDTGVLPVLSQYFLYSSYTVAISSLTS